MGLASSVKFEIVGATVGGAASSRGSPLPASRVSVVVSVVLASPTVVSSVLEPSLDGVVDSADVVDASVVELDSDVAELNEAPVLLSPVVMSSGSMSPVECASLDEVRSSLPLAIVSDVVDNDASGAMVSTEASEIVLSADVDRSDSPALASFASVGLRELGTAVAASEFGSEPASRGAASTLFGSDDVREDEQADWTKQDNAMN